MKKPKIRFKGFTDDWEQRKLGEYVSITSGEAPLKFEEGTELYVKVDDLNYNDKYVVDTQNKVAEHSTVKRVTKGSVVFPKRGAAIMTNKVRILDIDSYMDTNMMALTSERLDSEFLYNIISKEGLYKIADTSTIPQINNKHIEPYEVKIPSLDEQRRIGVYFKQLDQKITLHQRECEQLKTFKKYMLQNMFPENGEKVPKIRFKGFTDDWEQRKFGDLAVYKKGPFGSSLKKDVFVPRGNTTVKVYEQQNAINKDWTLERYFITKDYAKKLSSFIVKPGEIIVSCAGTIGEIYELPSNAEYGIINQALMKIRVEESLIQKRIFIILFSNMIDEFTRTHSNGSAIKNIPPFGDLKPKKVLVPLLEKEQEKIGTFFSTLDNLITLHQRKCEQLKKLKKYMLQNMFI